MQKPKLPERDDRRWLSLDEFNALCYELAGDLDLVRKAWIIPAFKSHLRHVLEIRNYRVYDATFERSFDNWIGVKQGRLNAVPRSLP